MSYECAHDGYLNYSLSGNTGKDGQTFWVNDIGNLTPNTGAPFTCTDSNQRQYYVSTTEEMQGAPPATNLFGKFSCSITPSGERQICEMVPDPCRGLCKNGSRCGANGKCDCSTGTGRQIDSCWGADGDGPPDDKRSPRVVLWGDYCDMEYLPRGFVTRTHNYHHECNAMTGGLQCEPGTHLQEADPYECGKNGRGVITGDLCSLPDGSDYRQAGLDHACSR